MCFATLANSSLIFLVHSSGRFICYFTSIFFHVPALAQHAQQIPRSWHVRYQTAANRKPMQGSLKLRWTAGLQPPRLKRVLMFCKVPLFVAAILCRATAHCPSPLQQAPLLYDLDIVRTSPTKSKLCLAETSKAIVSTITSLANVSEALFPILPACLSSTHNCVAAPSSLHGGLGFR